MIEIKDISKHFDDKLVLDNVSVQFQTNSISVILGKSGEGKSTLFRIMSGLERKDSGFLNYDMNDIGMVFQDYQLYPHLNVQNNLVLPQRLVLKKSKNAAKKIASDTLKLLNIEYLKNSKISSLSGGESQRVAIARTLVMNKSIILFDEPTSALDKENIDNLTELLKSLKKDKTILIITHDSLFAKAVSDDIYIIQNGTLKKA